MKRKIHRLKWKGVALRAKHKLEELRREQKEKKTPKTQVPQQPWEKAAFPAGLSTAGTAAASKLRGIARQTQKAWGEGYDKGMSDSIERSLSQIEQFKKEAFEAREGKATRLTDAQVKLAEAGARFIDALAHAFDNIH